jgi:hypothetical protein
MGRENQTNRAGIGPVVRRLGAIVTGVALTLGGTGVASAVPVIALTDENDLLVFDSSSPVDTSAGMAITDLGPEDLIGIDYRPTDDEVYAVGNLGTVYRINLTTFAATPVSTLTANPGDLTSPFTALSGSRFGVDFNPVSGLLRLVSDQDQNLTVNALSGQVTTDGSLFYAAGQTGATGDNPIVTGTAYTNNVVSPSGTTLYAIDVRNNEDRLVIEDGATGSMTVVGSLGINVGTLLGFDIYTDDEGGNFGLAALQLSTGGFAHLYAINLTTGATTDLGELGGGDFIDGLTVVPNLTIVPEPTSLATLTFFAAGAILTARRRH